MTISICDDNRGERERLKELVSQYKRERGIPKLDILNYDSPGKLAADLSRVESDAYLLDIVFHNGNELEDKIRQHYRNNPIIFVSSPARSVRNMSSFCAVRYYVKPHELFEMLDHTLDLKQTVRAPIYSLNTTKGRQQILFNDIMYVERSAQVLLLTTSNGRVHESVTLRESFASKVKPLLEDPRFTQTHVSFLVNMDAIETYHKDEIVMRDGHRIPISRKFIPIVKEKYATYFC